MHINKYSNKLKVINAQHSFFKKSLFPSVISEWNNLDSKIRESATLETYVLAFIRLRQSSFRNYTTR